MEVGVLVISLTVDGKPVCIQQLCLLYPEEAFSMTFKRKVNWDVSTPDDGNRKVTLYECFGPPYGPCDNDEASPPSKAHRRPADLPAREWNKRQRQGALG
jgi:hypothetical protein